MNKISFKNVFSKAFVVALVAMAARGADVNALSLNEKADVDIADGSYIIGISKFTPDQTLTGRKVSKATSNDFAYNVDVPGYAGAEIYYYAAGDWYVLDDENNYNAVTDSKLISSLSSRDVYYVNNVEKVFELNYQREVPKGKTLKFDTGKSNKDVKYDAAKGIMTVPATVKTVTVNLHDEATNTDTVIDTFVKTADADDAGVFEYKNNTASVGAITADARFTADNDVVVNGNNITINGTIGWAGKTVAHGASIASQSDVAGHRVGVVLTLPNGTNLANLDQIKVVVNPGSEDEEELPWSNANSNRKSEFWFTPIVKAGETITLQVAWPNGITQTYTIKVNGTLEEMPAGKLSGESKYVFDTEKNDYTDEVRLSATAAVDNSSLTFAGKSIDWDDTVTVYVEPDEYYSNLEGFKLSDVTASYTYVIKNTNYDPNDELSREKEYIDIDPAVPVTPRVVTINNKQVLAIELPFSSEETVDTKTRKISLKIDWDGDYEQPVEVSLDGNTPFVYPEVAFKSVKATGDTHDYVNKDTTDTVTVDRYITWDVINGGNRVSAVIENKDFEDDELGYLTLKVNGEVVLTKDLDGSGKEQKNEDGSIKMRPLTFADSVDGMTRAEYTWDFAVEKGKSYKLEVVWNGEKVVKTFNVSVTANVENSFPGIMEVTETDFVGLTSAISGTNNYDIVVNGTKIIDSQKGTYNAIPYNYDLNSNAVTVKLTNSKYSADSIKVVTKVANGEEVETTATAVKEDGKVTGYSLVVPVQRLKTTVVTVYWDANNAQVFNVSADNSRVSYAEPSTGTISIDGAAEGSVTQGKDLKALTYSGDANWVNGEGYTITGVTITAPQKVKKPAVLDSDGKVTTPAVYDNAFTVDQANGYVTISGGQYQDTDENADGYYKKALNTTGLYTETDGIGKVTLPIVVTDRSQTFKITIRWAGDYVETYTLNVVGANLTGASEGVLSAGAVDSSANGTLVYAEQIPYDSATGLYKLSATLKLNNAAVVVDNVDSIKVTDANPDVEEHLVNGVKVVTKNPREVKSELSTTGNVDLYFTNEDQYRTASVVILWKDGKEQTIKVNATDAKIPVITLSSAVVAEVKNNAETYTLTVNVGDTINLVKSTSALTGLTVTPSDAKKAYSTDEKDVVTNQKDDKGQATNIYTATAAGKVTMTVAGDNSKSYPITVYVLDKEDTKIGVTAATAVNEAGDKVEITAVPNGGREGKYNVKVESYVYVTKELAESVNADNIVAANIGKYVADPDNVGAVPANERLENGKYVATLDAKKGRQYKYVVTAKDATIDADALPTEYSEATYTIATEIGYTVSFESNGGNAVAAQVVKPNTAAEAPEVKKASTDKYFYVLKGWYEVNKTNFAANGDPTDQVNTDGYELDVNGDLVYPGAGEDFDEDAFSTTGYDFTADVQRDITLKAVWIRVPLKK